MKICRLFLFSLLLLSSAFALAQQPPAITAQLNTVYVSAEGKFESAPDTALIQFNISAQDDTARRAYDRGARIADQIRQMLRSNGIDAKAAEIGFFSLQPVYDYRTPKRKLLGYRVDSAVTLKLKDFSKLGPILQQLADMDITSNQSVNYTLEDEDAAKIKAVGDALRRAHDKAEAVARDSGRTLGELAYASVDTTEQIRPVVPLAMRAMAAGAAAPAPTEEFSPHKITVTARVNAIYALK